MRLLIGGGARSHETEEAEGVIVMVSDWLGLDAEDSWVRHDSETVSIHCCLRLLGW